jgi:peptidoglycan hydrolase FlgJ
MNISGNISAIASSDQTTTFNADAQRQAKLADAAHQFEGLFLQELLKPMQSKGGLDDGSDSSDDDSGDSADTLQSYGTEAIANAISVHGGFGIARRVIEQVNGEHQGREKALSNP